MYCYIVRGYMSLGKIKIIAISDRSFYASRTKEEISLVNDLLILLTRIGIFGRGKIRRCIPRHIPRHFDTDSDKYRTMMYEVNKNEMDKNEED